MSWIKITMISTSATFISSSSGGRYHRSRHSAFSAEAKAPNTRWLKTSTIMHNTSLMSLLTTSAGSSQICRQWPRRDVPAGMCSGRGETERQTAAERINSFPIISAWVWSAERVAVWIATFQAPALCRTVGVTRVHSAAMDCGKWAVLIRRFTGVFHHSQRFTALLPVHTHIHTAAAAAATQGRLSTLSIGAKLHQRIWSNIASFNYMW